QVDVAQHDQRFAPRWVLLGDMSDNKFRHSGVAGRGGSRAFRRSKFRRLCCWTVRRRRVPPGKTAGTTARQWASGMKTERFQPSIYPGRTARYCSSPEPSETSSVAEATRTWGVIG